MECVGRLCPPSLDMINTPKFVIRAGIIPYKIGPAGGEFLLGIKEGKYTDFGGGCKGSKLELPFSCAVREMREETGISDIDLNNITHIFISGKNKPHQIILLIKVDDFRFPAKVPKGELERMERISWARFSSLPKTRLQDSLKGIRDNLVFTFFD